LPEQSRIRVPAAAAAAADAPPSYAAEAAKTLSKSQHIVFPGIGHAASRWAPTCFATIMASFLDHPDATVDDSCLQTLAVPPFDIP
jgi:pimeloyl-ACP methyl ester carboxylesterase